MIWIILILGSFLRLVSLNQSLWLDEAINVMAAKSYSFFGMITQYNVADFHPPGWLAILWIWGKTFGYSEIAVRMPSVVFGVLTIYIIYLLGKKLISKNAGLLSALFLSINPLHIYYSQEARMYSLASLAVAINILLLTKIIKGEKVFTFLLIVSNLGVLLSDYVAYFIFPAQLIFILLLRRQEVVKRWVIGITGALVLLTPWLPVFLSQLDVGAGTSVSLPTWKFVVGGFDFKTIPLTFVKFIIGRISLTDKVIYAALLLPICSLFVYLMLRGIKSLNILSRNLLIAWLIAPPLIATAVSLLIPVYSYFRLLYIIPAFVILTASGVLSLRGKLRYYFFTTVILIELFCSGVYLLNPNYQREDWKGLVGFLQSQQSQMILFESSGTFPVFEYYANAGLPAFGALGDFPAKDQSSVSGLDDLLKDYRELDLVDYLVQISDPKRLVAQKLTELGYKKAATRDFHGVGFVDHYIK